MCDSFNVNRQIVLMRNPMDNFYSMFLIYYTRSHSLTVKNNIKEEFTKEWEYFVRDNCRWWQEFLDMTLKTSVQQIPTLFIRYEDLILKPEETLTDLMRFFLDTPSIEGTVVEAQIKKAT